MAEKKRGATGALVIVVEALEPLEESDRQWVLQSAAARWNVQLPRQGAGVTGGGGPAGGGGGAAAGGGGAADAQAAIEKKDPRAFMRLKRPTTDVQRIACLGYFLVHTTPGKLGFSTAEIRQANTDAGAPGMNFTRALDNATRKAKYLSKRGAREKQLTTLGEDIVVALPDQEAVKQTEAEAKGQRKARRKKKK
jgi:hypothetical protein